MVWFNSLLHFFIPGASDNAIKTCQSPKLVLAGEDIPNIGTDFPKYGGIQIFALGVGSNNLVSLHLPFSVSQYAGLNLTNAVANLIPGTPPTNKRVIVISGPALEFRGYLTTSAEYSVQRFEGASTIYGPGSLAMVTKFVDGFVPCALAGNCTAPLPAPATYKGCNEPTGNCYPYVDPTATNQLNGVTMWVLGVANQLPATPPTTISASIIPSNMGSYLAGSLSFATGGQVSANFVSMGIFSVKTMAAELALVNCTGLVSGKTVYVAYTDSDPETTVHIGCPSGGLANCTATVTFYYPSGFSFTQYTTCVMTFFASYQTSQTASIVTTSGSVSWTPAPSTPTPTPSTSYSSTPSAAPSPTKTP